MFRALLYRSEVTFYTENVHASVSNSMSVWKRRRNRRRKRRKRRSRWRKRYQIYIIIFFSGLMFYFCFHPSHLRPNLDCFSLVCSWPWLIKVVPDDTLYVWTLFLNLFSFRNLRTKCLSIFLGLFTHTL